MLSENIYEVKSTGVGNDEKLGVRLWEESRVTPGFHGRRG